MGATLVQAPLRPPEIDWRKNDWQEKEADYVATLAELARKQYSGDTVGEVLRWQRADGYAQYMVLSESPLRLVHLDLGDGYEVEAALLRGLTLKSVQAMVASNRALSELFRASNSIYDTLEPGTIVHYDNGFNEFIRCEAVPVPPGWASRSGSKPEGKVVLKPIALVGPMRHQEPDGTWVQGWHESDLVKRDRAGEIITGHYAEMVLEGELFQPNGGSIYESFEYHRRGKGLDPRKMEPIDLTPPPITAEQESVAPLIRALNRVRAVSTADFENLDDFYTPDSLRGVLSAIETIVKEALD